jgi:cephalosporin-C deacetylase-like acetyl esterase
MPAPEDFDLFWDTKKKTALQYPTQPAAQQSPIAATRHRTLRCPSQMRRS